MKISIVENKEYRFANLKFGEKPDYVKDKALLDELKAGGWGYSKNNGVWYPRTNEAKAKANDFAKFIIEKYSEPEKSFGQELFERSQRIDEWKKNHLNIKVVENTIEKESVFNDKQKQVYELIKSTGILNENQLLDIVTKIDMAYQEKNLQVENNSINTRKEELLKKVPEILKGRAFNSWIISTNDDTNFLFYEKDGYLKSEFLNQSKYESVKDFLKQVENYDLLEDSSKKLKEEYEKMHIILEKTPEKNQEEFIGKEVEKELEQKGAEEEQNHIKEINLTQQDLDNAQKIIPEEQYQFMLENAAGEEAEYFRAKLKKMSDICNELQSNSGKENINKDGSHPCKLHFYLGDCDWYISELDNDGIGYGYCILNGDLYNSEWGSVNVCGDSSYEKPLTKMSVNVPVRINGSEFFRNVSPEIDLHLEDDTTIERELYKLNNDYFNKYKKYVEKDEKVLAESSEVSINIIEETNQDLEIENGSKTDIGYEGRTGISSGSNLNQRLEEYGTETNWGSNSGRGQRVLYSEREENGGMENTERVSELHIDRRESEISNLHIEEGISSNNETLFSETGIGESLEHMQSTGMETGQISHRMRIVEPGNGTVKEPLEAVKEFKVPDEMIKKFDKAMAEMDFKVLHNYLNWGDRDIINDCHENDKAIKLLRERYEKTKGEKLPEQFKKTTDYLVLHCDKRTLPPECRFTTAEEAIAHAVKSWDGIAYQRSDGNVEYITRDNFKKNRDVFSLEKDLQKHESQSYLGYGGGTFGYQCNPKNVKIETFINYERIEFNVPWSEIAKIKAKQWNKEYPLEFTIKDDFKNEEKIKSVEMVQQDLFDFDEVKVQVKSRDFRNEKKFDADWVLHQKALLKYRGLPPFIKKSDNEWIIRCKGEDFAVKQKGISSNEIVDISLTKEQLQQIVQTHLFTQQQEINHKKYDNPEFKGKVNCPKPLLTDFQTDLLKENGISENDMKRVNKEQFYELLCNGENPVLHRKAKENHKIENTQQLIINDTDFDYDY